MRRVTSGLNTVDRKSIRTGWFLFILLVVFVWYTVKIPVAALYVPLAFPVSRFLAIAFLAAFVFVGFFSLSSIRTKSVVVFGFSGFYFIILLFITYYNTPGVIKDFYEFKNIIFVLISFAYGWFFANSVNENKNSEPSKLMLYLLGGFGLLVGLRMALFMNELLAFSVTRDFGGEALNAVSLAFQCGVAAVFFFALSFKIEDKKLKLLYITVFFSFFVSVILTASRGATLYTLLCVTVVVLLNLKQWRQLLNSFLLFSAAAVVGVILLAAFKTEILTTQLLYLWDRLEPARNLLMGESTVSIDDASSGRFEIYLYYFDLLPESLLLGLKNYNPNPYPHNQFLETLIRFGVIGIVLIVFVIRSLVKCLRAISNFERASIYDVAFSIIGVFVFLQSMTSLSLEMLKPLWVVCGYFLARNTFDWKVPYYPMRRRDISN